MGNNTSKIIKHCTLLIDINQYNNIKCSIIDSQNKEQQIKINKNQQDEYLPITILFDMNEIILNEQRDDSINFFNDWINKPDEFQEYEIKYQNKQYSVISEVLFALFLFHYTKVIEKDWIIDKTELNFEAQSNNQMVVNRIKVSLDSIGLKIDEFEFPEFDYQKQGESLHEILDKYNEYTKYKSLLEKSKHQELNDNTQPLNEERFNEITQRKLTLKERNNICQLDNYCIFLSSIYFETIDDHINLVKTCKRLKLNMEKFHFNPIELTTEIREYFPKIQTFYIYKRNGFMSLNDNRIKFRKISFYPYYLDLEEKKNIEQWTGLKCGEILFDSDKDDWNQNTSQFNDKIEGKSNFIIVVEDSENNKFGYYFGGKIQPRTYRHFMKGYKSFLFSLKSNGRYKKMMKFEEEIYCYGVMNYSNDDKHLFGIACGFYLRKRNTTQKSDIWNNDQYFNYHGMTTALNEKLNKSHIANFTPTRFFVIQMI